MNNHTELTEWKTQHPDTDIDRKPDGFCVCESTERPAGDCGIAAHRAAHKQKCCKPSQSAYPNW